MTPNSRPKATRALVERLAKAAAKKAGVTLPTVYLVGVRGYYRDTMGKVGTNDRGIYDDALFIVGPETFTAFNAHTHRGGNNTASPEGCQTVPPKQWGLFHGLMTKELKAAGQKTFPYILLEGPIT